MCIRDRHNGGGKKEVLFSHHAAGVLFHAQAVDGAGQRGLGPVSYTHLYEDNHLLAVVKPVNMPVQRDRSGDEDLLSLLKRYIAEKYHKPGEAYLGLVHRLDRPVGRCV